MKRILATLFIMAFSFSLFGAKPIEVGATAPALTVTTHTGESLDLAEVYARGPVLVYFYPKADTPGCTAQACNLRDNFDAVTAAGITVLGVSTDTVARQAEFRDKYDLPFTLIADPDQVLGKAFGVGGVLGMGFFKRQSFLVVNGKIAWRDLSAKPGSQSEDAIKALVAARAAPAGE